MDLNTLWFGIITFLFIGFLFLEGFDFGVGMLMPFLGKNAAERRLVVSAIGPFWDGNEVWLLVSGAAMFAAFPGWYATMFSGFYLVMVGLLVALILRGVGFEFRNRHTAPLWQRFWDAMIAGGSFVTPFIWGVALTNLIKGLPIDGKQHYVGALADLFSPYALLGGLTLVSLCLLHGANFLSLKTEGVIRGRAERAARLLWLPVFLAAVGLGGYSVTTTDIFSHSQLALGAAIAAGAALAGVGICLQSGRFGLAFLANGLVIILVVLAIFSGLFPRVMVSSLNPDWSLTITNSAASPKSLEISSWFSLTLIPVIIGYQAWNYWVFRRRVSLHSTAHL
jgi:cytochrome bd ubiquinol oxidase subunit II